MGRMGWLVGWLGGLGLCDIARSVNQPFSYASCSIIFLWGVRSTIYHILVCPARAMFFFHL